MQLETPPEAFDLTGMVADLNGLLRLKTTVIGIKMFARSEDMMAIPKDAPNADAAHKFINFVMEPQITADITNYVAYASANAAAMPLISDEIKNNPGIFPAEDVKGKLWTSKVKDAKADRFMTRLWTEVKTGQ